MAGGDWLGEPATLVMGLPLLVVWSYVIILSCVAVMLVGNRIVERDDHE